MHWVQEEDTHVLEIDDREREWEYGTRNLMRTRTIDETNQPFTLLLLFVFYSSSGRVRAGLLQQRLVLAYSVLANISSIPFGYHQVALFLLGGRELS